MKIKTTIKTIFLLWSFLLVIQLQAQEKVINGSVSDAAIGEPLPGATIIIVGTEIGTIADFDGNFSLSYTEGDILTVSFIGYFSKEVEIGPQANIAIQLEPDFAKLDEVIVIGYGAQKKTDKTGAVSMVTSEELNQGVMQDPIQALQGKVAGVSISKPGSDPNAGFNVKIRGSSGFRSNTQPLFVVDGVPGVDPTTISNEDIESYNVLKDASSTAIYGSRGANGVIIIQTKKGDYKKGNTVEFNTYYSIDKIAKKYDLLSASELREYVETTGKPFSDGGADVDWQDEIFRTGATQNYNLAASGGSETSNYRFSLTHTDFMGVINGSGKERTIGRLNVGQKAINDRLNIQATMSGTIEHNDYVSYDGSGPNDVIYQALQRNPTDPLYDENGDFYEISRDFNYYNPAAIISQKQDERDAKRFLGNLKLDFEIAEGLVAGVNLGYIRDDAESFVFEPSSFRGGTTAGFAKREYKNHESKLIEGTLSYSKVIATEHNLNVVGGYSFQEDVDDGFFAQGNDPYSDYTQSHDLGGLLDVVPGRDIDSWKGSFRVISFFGRAVYNYNSKYYFTGTVRRDGSSKFGKNNEWGIFPSVSAAWNLKQESFLQNVGFLSQLKLRVGWGITGNQEFPNYLGVLTYESIGTAPNFETGEDAIGYQGTHSQNPDLKWEENEEYNIGVDFGIYNNRVSGSLELYSKNTYDLLNNYIVEQTDQPVNNLWANAGAIDNKGFEAIVTAHVVQQSNFEWSFNFTFAKNNLTISSLSSGEFVWSGDDQKKGDVDGRGVSGGAAWTQYLSEGNAIGTFYMPEYVGIDDDGNLLYQDAYGNVSTTPNFADTARVMVGQGLPDFELAWSNTFKIYKHFDLGFSLRTVIGHDIYNVTRMFFVNYNSLPNLNVMSEAIELYNDGVIIQSNPAVSSYYLEKGSFARLDHLTFGYTLPNKKVKWAKHLRIYTTVNNLFTITNYSGMDPEVKYDDDGLEVGMEQYNVYPKTRSYVFGLQVKF